MAQEPRLLGLIWNECVEVQLFRSCQFFVRQAMKDRIELSMLFHLTAGKAVTKPKAQHVSLLSLYFQHVLCSTRSTG